MTPSRRALLAAGVATLAVSLVLSIAPVIAANGNGNSNGNLGGGSGGGNAGTIKIHDAATGLETDASDNDPHVCAFWVAFYAAEPFESGTWQLVSWAPTGDGSVVASGDYDTTGDGLDATETLSPDAGHYRFEWVAAGSNNGKNKTLWVDDTCGADDAPPGDETPPSDEETPPSDEEVPPSQDETPASDEEVPPSDEEVPPSDEEVPPSDEETPPSDEETPPSQDETPASEEEVPPSDEETPPSGEETAPSQDETPASDEEVPPSQDGTPDEGEGDVLPGNPIPSDPVAAPESDVAAGGSATMLPDTSLPLESTGGLAALGLLLIVAAHVGTRRRPLRG